MAAARLLQKRELWMFEVGKLYEVEFIEAGGERSFVHGEAPDFAGSLPKLLVDNCEKTYNTSASNFVAVREWKKPGSSLFASGPAPTRNA